MTDGEATVANPRDDREAKSAFARFLVTELGYDNTWPTSRPVDVVATRGDELYRFEVKCTGTRERVFGAATITEWQAALEDEDHFSFVLAYRVGGEWHFDLFSPTEFKRVSTIPPMKVHFHLGRATAEAVRHPRGRSAIAATRRRLRQLIALYQSLDAVIDE